MGAMLGLVGPMLGIGSSLAGLFGGAPANNVQMPQQWQMPHMSGAADNAYNNIGTLSGMNLPAALLPQYTSTANNMMNNPFAPGAMAGAGAAAGYGYNAANSAATGGDYLTQLARGVTPYAMGVMNTGFDPQSDLRARMAFNTEQGARAANEARGIDTTPYGAGLENDAMRNFNIDWQNAALGRQTQGLQAGTGALGQMGQLYGSGVNMAGLAPGLAQQAGLTPYSTFQGIGNDQFGTLGQLSNAGITATNIPQQGITNYLNYLGVGNNAGSVANSQGQLALNQANSGFQQNQTMGGQLGNSFAGLSQGLNRMYGWGTPGGGAGGSGGSGGYSTAALA